ncbi:MAG: hypothetical protein ACRDVO_01860, partial [Jiangellaceae bacterium]
RRHHRTLDGRRGRILAGSPATGSGRAAGPGGGTRARSRDPPRGVDLLGLSTATRLHLGDDAVVEVTGLRNPCIQIDEYRRGLLKEVVGRGETGAVVYKAGVMGVVLTGGDVRPGDPIRVVRPPHPHRPLERV